MGTLIRIPLFYRLSILIVSLGVILVGCKKKEDSHLSPTSQRANSKLNSASKIQHQKSTTTSPAKKILARKMTQVALRSIMIPWMV